jgi:hypothetical protein
MTVNTSNRGRLRLDLVFAFCSPSPSRTSEGSSTLRSPLEADKVGPVGAASA